MKTFLSRHRFEVLALALGLLFCALHVWVDRSPSVGLQEGGGSGENVLLRSLHIFEGRATDVQFRVRGHRAPHPDVVVVAVDEKSVQALGRWPWPRQVLARAIDRLREAGVASVGLDMTFTDEVPDERAQAYAETVAKLDQVLAETPEPPPALLTLREELKVRSSSSGDEALAAALARAPQVVQGVIAYSRKERAQFASQALEREPTLSGHLIRRLPGSVPGSFHEVNPEKLVAWRSHSIQIPLPAFVQASKRLGHFNVAPDLDGTVRRLPPFILLEGPAGLIPQLELQTAAAYLNAELEPTYDPSPEVRRITGARLRRADGTLLPLEVPVPFDDPLMPVNYPGPAKVFPTVSLSDVVEGKVDPAALKGKAVLLGVTLVGNFDQRVTPFSELEPGVYIHAAFLSNILSQDFLTRPLFARPLELLFMLCASLLLARLLPRVRFAWKLGATALLIASWLTVDQLLFARGMQLATVLPLGSVIISAFGVMFLGYFSVDAEKARLRDTFQHYLDASVMEQVLAHPEKLKLGGERKELSVLFSDIRGFTTLSERMTPEQLVAFINQYLTPMTDIVFSNGGTLDKYIGDAIMAFWGAPVDQPDHALRACRAALGFVAKLDELRAGWRAVGMPEVDIGVGINSGFMNVGHMGTANRFNYTVMGDAVNLASRLEGLNKTYDTRILISAETYAHVQGRVTSRRLGVVRVKGKQAVTDIHELRAMGPPSGKDADAIEAFEAGVECFISREFVQAEGYFRRVLMLWPDDKPARRYLDELNVLRWNRPGPDWDGVFTATTK